MTPFREGGAVRIEDKEVIQKKCLSLAVQKVLSAEKIRHPGEGIGQLLDIPLVGPQAAGDITGQLAGDVHGYNLSCFLPRSGSDARCLRPVTV